MSNSVPRMNKGWGSSNWLVAMSKPQHLQQPSHPRLLTGEAAIHKGVPKCNEIGRGSRKACCCVVWIEKWMQCAFNFDEELKVSKWLRKCSSLEHATEGWDRSCYVSPAVSGAPKRGGGQTARNPFRLRDPKVGWPHNYWFLRDPNLG